MNLNEQIYLEAWRKLRKDIKEWYCQINSFDTYINGTEGLRKILKLTSTPDVLIQLKVPQLPITMDVGNLAKILSDKEGHNLSKLNVKQLPLAITEPIMVFESATRSNAFVLLTDIMNNGRFIMVAILLDRERQNIKVHDVVSAYTRRNIWYINEIENGRLLYQDKNKSLNWARTNRLQLPKVRKLPERLLNDKLLTEADIVKPSLGKKLADLENNFFAKKALDILKSCNLFDEWCKDYVYGNFPEIGQSALCVDLDDDRVFYEYDPIGKVEPKSENIVVISVYENLSSSIIDIKKTDDTFY